MHDSSYRTIPLYGCEGLRGHALVSPEDYEELGRYRWNALRNGYVVRSTKVAVNKWRHVYMHRQVLGIDGIADRQVQGDHINHDKKDNRRENLRVVTDGQNKQNLRSNRGTTSRYRGVNWDASRGKWLVRVHIDGKSRNLGRYDSEDEAGQVAAEYRAKHMPFSTDLAEAA